jgi:hypothetical protein
MPTRPTSGGADAPRRYGTCHRCGKKFRIPDGWSVGPAARRHYWAKHRDVMQPKKSR